MFELCFIAAGVLMLLCVLGSNESSAETITVDKNGGADYTTIQPAIENSTDGDLIKIMPGHYYETLEINNSISMIGENRVTIFGNNSDTDVITINANDVQIKNIFIQNSSNGAGIYSRNFINISIQNCSFKDVVSVFSGVNLRNADHAEVLFCNFENAGGVRVQFSDDVNVEHCTVNGWYDKIYVTYSNYAIISRNTVINACYGISILHGSNGLIQYNQVYNCEIGIHDSYSRYLQIHHNNIYNNSDHGLKVKIHEGDNREIVNATENWWGHSSGPYHPDNNSDGEGNNVSDNVEFNPWLEQGWTPVDRDLSLRLNTELRDIKPSSPFELNFSALNCGTVSAGNVTLEVFIDGNLFHAETLNLSANSSKNISTSLNFSESGWHLLKIVIDPENNLEEYDESNNIIVKRVFVVWRHYFNLSTDTTQNQVLPSQSTTFSLNITNTGWANDTYAIEAAFPENWFAYTHQNFITIPSNLTDTVTIIVLAPANARAGFEAPITVTVHSAGNTSLNKTITFTAIVQQVYSFAWEIESPGSFTPDHENTVTIRIQNTG
ncbi:MAG: right-handed parallel beta-helix repeat-containing protein, partial [Thermoplasmata archaeon]|nr:right-handed parallel beta-helix repeat-containing protein [Thermoplasmata archaeon]